MYAASGTPSNPWEATTTDGYPSHDPENRCGRYILDAEGNPVPEPNLFKWAMWLEVAHRSGALCVADDYLAHGHRVATHFLGLDHNSMRLIDPEGERPHLYETMVFNDYGCLETDWACERYATRAEALEGHAAALVELKLHLEAMGVST